jgi:hypothetical protein
MRVFLVLLHKSGSKLEPHSEENAVLRPFEIFILVVVFAYMDNIILNSFFGGKSFQNLY